LYRSIRLFLRCSAKGTRTIPGMLECFVAGVEDNTLLSAGSIWESCLDTSMLQSHVYRDMVAAWGAADKIAGNETDVFGNLAAPAAIFNVTHQMKSWVHVLHVDAIAVSGVMWCMMIAMSVAIISYICCSSGTTSPPPLAGASSKGAAQKGSAPHTSLSPSWVQRRQPHFPCPVSSSSSPHKPRSARGSAPHTPRSARDAQAGQPSFPLCEKDGDPYHALGFGSGLLSPTTATTAASSAASVTPRGFLFTVPMEALLDTAGKSSFSIKDTFSSVVLRGLVSENPHNFRKVQLFLGDDATIPCASMEQPPPGSQAIPGSLELRGAKNIHLGSLILQSTGSFVLRAVGQPDLIFEGKEADLDLHVFSRDGGLKATVTCKDMYPGGPEQVEIHVLPGIDSVLIVACTLAILFLCGER